MKNKKIIKYSLLIALILAIQIKGQSLSEFLGHWTGTEELNSPSLTYENRNISLTIEEGGVREGFHIFTSSSDFLHNEDVEWAFHYFGFDKSKTQLIFLRRFITPIGIIGYEELVYDLTDYTSEYFAAEYYSPENETYHQIRMNLNLMEMVELNPKKIKLSKNYPNPFNPTTSIDVSSDGISFGELIIYDIGGKKVSVIHSGQFFSGDTRFKWNGTDFNGNLVSSGAYIYHLIIDGSIVDSQKMLLLK